MHICSHVAENRKGLAILIFELFENKAEPDHNNVFSIRRHREYSILRSEPNKQFSNLKVCFSVLLPAIVAFHRMECIQNIGHIA